MHEVSFVDCQAGSFAGGVFIGGEYNSPPPKTQDEIARVQLINCTFLRCVCRNSDTVNIIGRGGAIYMSQLSTVEMTGCSVLGCITSSLSGYAYGGGVCVTDGAALSAHATEFRNCSASGMISGRG
eukprot:3426935-Prymnesium_polylepis.1